MHARERLGGKAANLVWMRDAGLPVPPFTVLTTDAYRRFVAEQRLQPVIDAALAHDDAQAAEIIRSAFRRPIGEGQRAEIAGALAGLGEVAVAVRSSATAEDLPDASFAGQQDTFLGVRGLDAVVHAVVECWSSLWTERAIAYRRRNGVPHEQVALAVVIQQMVDADASGVLFTADPLTGRRDLVVVDAVAGLGEALVSGQVTPTHYEVDAEGAVTRRAPGASEKDASTHAPERLDAFPSDDPLTPAQLAALVALGRRVAALAGAPQDIEWTRTGDDLQLVQARAITSLYPLPQGPDGPRAGDLWFSVGAAQGVLAPLTPLGSDALRVLAAGAASLFGHASDYRSNAYVASAGERLWGRLDGLLATPVGRRLVPLMLRAADPNAGVVIGRLLDERARPGRPARRDLTALARNLAHFGAPTLPRLARSVVDPAGARARLDATASQLIEGTRRDLALADRASEPDRRLALRVDALDRLAERAFPSLLPAFVPIMGPSLALLQRLRTLAARTGLPDADALALTALRSLPGNVTTAMDLALWDASQQIAADPAARALVAGTDAAELAAQYAAGGLPAAVRAPMDAFLERFGMRGVAEIDLGTPRWRDDSAGVWTTVQAYLATPADAAPDRLYDDGRRSALDAIERLAGASTPVRARQIRLVAHHLRNLFGARETPKFTFVTCLGLIREALLASATDLVAAGVLDDAHDVFFLHLDELRDAFAATDLRPLVAERRGVRAREERRTRVPIVMLGDGRTFYDAGTTGDADLAGMGVSPGVVEGRACVVDDPRTSTLAPGDILVCRGTDPAWTPLFLTAAGLVTEVGGLMTHGSVVAREYGLPAVVGVSGATDALRDRRRVRLDGTAGTIEFL